MIDPSETPDYSAMLRLDGQNHVIIGAGFGMGRQTALAYASVGARVFCIDVDPERAASVASETGGVAGVADVTKPGEIDQVLEEAHQKLGRIDGATNIVGVAKFLPLLDTTDEDWDFQHSMVARQAFQSLRAAAPYLKQAGGGSLTFVSSVSALTSAPSHGAYGMSKAAIMSMVRTAAIELGPFGIRVNSVAPGTTITPRLREPYFAKMLEENVRRTPIRKLGAPSDIAAALLFLTSPLAGHISGQNLVVDGGLSQAYPVATPDEV
jgi:NAD(P)-dependent dehydrogenase (short-subunit alcohol dehydrogenase family)